MDQELDIRPAAFWAFMTTLLCLSATCLGILVFGILVFVLT